MQLGRESRPRIVIFAPNLMLTVSLEREGAEREQVHFHPGGQGVEGNPGMGGGKDLDPVMRIVFWPAVIGWALFGVWITTLRIRLEQFKEKQPVNG